METFVARVHEAIGSGDVGLMRAIISDNATVWENTDSKTRRFSDVLSFHRLLAQSLQSIGFDNVRITQTENGYIEQHDKILVRANGERFCSPACMVVAVENEKIVSVEEYLDASSFPPEVAESRRRADAGEL